MSDSTNSSFRLLSNWKLGLAVCVPCFAVGLGVAYYYYAKTLDNSSQKDGNVSEKKNNVSQNLTTSTGINHNDIHDSKKVQTVNEQIKDLKKQGKIDFAKGNFVGAIVSYTHALKMCPESEKKLLSSLYQNRAVAHSKLNKLENCVADCDKALTLVPTYIKALSQRSRAFAQLKKYKLALDDITAAVMLNNSKNKSDVEFADFVMTTLCNLNIEEYKKNNAFDLPSKTFIDNYIKSFHSDPFNDEFLQSLIKSDVNTGLELALKNLKDKNYDMIEEVCKEELNKSDNSLIRKMWALNLLATFFILRGNYEDGIKHLNTIIETPEVPNRLVANSLIKRASVYHQQEQVDKSIEDFQQAEKIDPSCSEIFHHRAQIYLQEMNYEKAVEYFKKAIKVNPNFFLSYVQCYYTQFLHAKKTSNELDSEKCLKKLKGCTIKYPDNSESYTLYAQTLSLKGVYEEADSLYKKVHELNPENAICLVDRALLVMSWKTSVNEAVELLQQAIKLDPKCDYAYETFGTLCIQTGKLKEAIELFNIGVTLCKPEKEMFHIFALRNSAEAHLRLIERFSLTLQGK